MLDTLHQLMHSHPLTNSPKYPTMDVLTIILLNFAKGCLCSTYHL